MEHYKGITRNTLNFALNLFQSQTVNRGGQDDQIVYIENVIRLDGIVVFYLLEWNIFYFFRYSTTRVL